MNTADAPHASAEVCALYQPLSVGSWELSVTPMVFCPGYWGAPQAVTNMAALHRDGDVWMSLTPLEIESQGIGVFQASGHVVILGLGMGWAAAECALLPEVDAVTVVERDGDVIALHRELNLFERLPDGCGSKVAVVAGDALQWQSDRPVDTLLADIWLPLISDTNRAEEVRQMQANIMARSIHFWGQELEIARQAVAAGRTLDADGIAATIADFNLPLIGPETPDYTARLNAAARNWMRDRWLPGSENPFT